MPWEKQYDETDVLERAMEAFWARGYEATSINDLVAATGINRGSLYAGFSDKRSLFLRALDHYDREHRQAFVLALERDHAPREAILAAFRQVVEACEEGRNRKGCLLVNTAIELSLHDSDIGDIVKAKLEEVETFFRARIEAAQKEGTIRPEIPAAEKARVLFGLFIGLRVITRSRPDPVLMASIVNQVEALLD
jgi:TetR/AcrR family transcriptional repressor of nem operon